MPRAMQKIEVKCNNDIVWKIGVKNNFLKKHVLETWEEEWYDEEAYADESYD